MRGKTLNELFEWLNRLSNRDLQRIHSETNEILLRRYDQQLKQQNEYAANMSSALCLLGQKQTKQTKLAILDKLEKTTGVYYKFDDLIDKIKKGLSND